jgi:hypothetical protein
METLNDKMALSEVFNTLQPFMTHRQQLDLNSLVLTKEWETIFPKMIEMAERVKSMPTFYEQDLNSDEAIAYLRIRMNGGDWYVIERCKKVDEKSLSFCVFRKGMGRGFVNEEGLLFLNPALDLDFKPTPLGEILSTTISDNIPLTVTSIAVLGASRSITVQNTSRMVFETGHLDMRADLISQGIRMKMLLWMEDGLYHLYRNGVSIFKSSSIHAILDEAVTKADSDREQMDYLIKIAADSIVKLRKSDVDRVLSEAPSEHFLMLANFIVNTRPDLAEEVHSYIGE